MRVMDWNIEHMNSWWTGGRNPVLRDTFAGNNFSPAVGDVPGLAQRCGNVISAVDPDVLALQEAAGQPELEEFFDRFVDGPWRIFRGSGGGQALAVAARTDRVTDIAARPAEVGGLDLNAPIVADVDGDGVVAGQKFARVPQVVHVEIGGHEVLVVNNHLKSKFVNDGEAMFDAGGERRQEFFAGALVARRRISAEAYRIRQFLDAVLVADPGRHVVLAGDLNDGAGADFFEERFLTHSVVDRIFGSVFFPDRQLAHVLFHSPTFDLAADFTARFHDFILDQMMDLVLDHIGLSPSLAALDWTGRVAANEFAAQTLDDGQMAAGGFPDRDRTPSDHRPVVADVPL